jgi:hypothetical protein
VRECVSLRDTVVFKADSGELIATTSTTTCLYSVQPM